MGRYTAIGFFCLVLLTLLLAGCGGSSGSGSTASLAEPCAKAGLTLAEYGACIHRELAEGRPATSREPEGTEPPEEEIGGPLSYVGTIKNSDGEGTTLIDRYRIGPLSYGEEAPPPAAVLEACGVNSPSETAASVFARGQISVTYREGSLPETIGIGEENTVEGEGIEGVLQVASLVNGEWQCLQQEPGSGGMELQPGETVIFPIWFVGDLVLSNSRPRLPQDVLDSLHIRAVGSLNLISGELQISGPGAANCEGELRLLLYGRPPVRMPTHPPYGGLTCRPV
ncbi:MAG: hypothetical protein ACRD3E_01670 [Terriglobales bacterium]